MRREGETKRPEKESLVYHPVVKDFLWELDERAPPALQHLGKLIYEGRVDEMQLDRDAFLRGLQRLVAYLRRKKYWALREAELGTKLLRSDPMDSYIQQMEQLAAYDAHESIPGVVARLGMEDGWELLESTAAKLRKHGDYHLRRIAGALKREKVEKIYSGDPWLMAYGAETLLRQPGEIPALVGEGRENLKALLAKLARTGKKELHGLLYSALEAIGYHAPEVNYAVFPPLDLRAMENGEKEQFLKMLGITPKTAPWYLTHKLPLDTLKRRAEIIASKLNVPVERLAEIYSPVRLARLLRKDNKTLQKIFLKPRSGVYADEKKEQFLWMLGIVPKTVAWSVVHRLPLETLKKRAEIIARRLNVPMEQLAEIYSPRGLANLLERDEDTLRKINLKPKKEGVWPAGSFAEYLKSIGMDIDKELRLRSKRTRPILRTFLRKPRDEVLEVLRTVFGEESLEKALRQRSLETIWKYWRWISKKDTLKPKYERDGKKTLAAYLRELGRDVERELEEYKSKGVSSISDILSILNKPWDEVVNTLRNVYGKEKMEEILKRKPFGAIYSYYYRAAPSRRRSLTTAREADIHKEAERFRRFKEILEKTETMARVMRALLQNPLWPNVDHEAVIKGIRRVIFEGGDVHKQLHKFIEEGKHEEALRLLVRLGRKRKKRRRSEKK